VSSSWAGDAFTDLLLAALTTGGTDVALEGTAGLAVAVGCSAPQPVSPAPGDTPRVAKPNAKLVATWILEGRPSFLVLPWLCGQPWLPNLGPESLVSEAVVWARGAASRPSGLGKAGSLGSTGSQLQIR
jgi:hypothetical protein